MIPMVESVVRKVVYGTPVGSKISKLAPNYYQYPSNSRRRITTSDGINFDLDISDIVDWFIYFGLKERSKEKLVQAASMMTTIIDVGANIGEISLRTAKENPQSQIYAFEPDPVNHGKLLKNLALNRDLINVLPIKKGLGDKISTGTLLTETEHNRGRNKIVSRYAKNEKCIDH